MAGGGTDRRHIATADEHRPGRRNEPADGVEQGRLAGTIGADQPDQLAGLDLEAHTVDRDVAAEPHDDVFGRERGHARLERDALAACGRLLRDRRRGCGGWLLGKTGFGTPQQPVATAVDDLQQTPGEVHQQHEQADVGGEEPLEVEQAVGGDLGEATNPQRTEDRTGDRAQTADDRDHDDLHRFDRRERHAGLKTGDHRDEQAARERCHAARHREGGEFHPSGRHRRGSGHLLVVAHRDQGASHTGGADAGRDPRHHHQRAEYQVVEVGATLPEVDPEDHRRFGRTRDRRSAREDVLHQQPPSRGDGEREGRDRQEEASDPQCGQADDHRERDAGDRASEDGQTPRQFDGDVEQIERDG